MLRHLLNKNIGRSLRKVKKVEKAQPLVKAEKNENTVLQEDKEFFEAKKKILSQHRECSIYDLIEQGIDVTKYMDMEYKQYPNHIDHWNHHSEHHIDSPLEEARMHNIVNSHNDIIDNFKNSLKIQREVMETIKKLDRPYLKGDKGNTTNIYNPIKSYANQEGLRQSPNQEMDDVIQQFRNEKMLVNNLPYHSKLDKPECLLELEKIREEAPVNDHFHPKGYKFDVEVPYEERYPHVADRLGHPEIFLTPLESLLRVDRMLTHPNFVDQPFVQVPKAEPDKDVDFTTGELLYENSNSLEWSRFFIYSSNLFFFYTFGYIPLHKMYASSTMPIDTLQELGINFIQFDPRTFDQLNLVPLIFSVLFASGFYLNNALIHKILSPNVERIQYNKSKDLIFVKGVGIFGFEKNMVYEMDHLEIKAGYNKSSTMYNDYSDDGVMSVSCLNTFNNMTLLNHPKYWNSDLKEEFLGRVNRLWDRHYVEDGIFEKYTEK